MAPFGKTKGAAYWCFALFALVSTAVTANEADHLYSKGDTVVLWANNVGPYNNPQESYHFFSLPWCTRMLSTEEDQDPELHRASHLGEVLHGVDHVYSRMRIKFMENTAQVTCKQTLDENAAMVLDRAVRKQWWYQMHLDDLPLWGMVGEVVSEAEAREHTQRGSYTGSEAYIYTHRAFVITYNGPRIISVNMTTDFPVLIQKGARLEFSYSVDFRQTTDEYESRFVKYLDNNFFQHQIHWFSILNAFMMVLFLCGVVAVILIRTLRRDYAKYNIDQAELGAFGVSSGDDSGWKIIHGDVFRAPPELLLLSIVLGNGIQLILVFLLVCFMSIWGSFYQNRGATAKWGVIWYALTSFASGFASARFYKLHYTTSRGMPRGAGDWKAVMVLSSILLPCVGLMMLVYLNCFSLWYATVNTVPFSSLALIGEMIFFVCLPLSALGTFTGRYVTTSQHQLTPCRVRPVARPVPARKWFLSFFALVPVSGILPFGSIFIEMYFMFSSFWNYKFYYVYGFLLLVFVILTMVTVCVTIVHTYTQLNFEDHRWQWPAFASGGSVALYVWLYSVYYYVAKTQMDGILQLSYYFCYMTALSVGLLVLCGTIGYFGSEFFVWKIYSGLKME